MRITQKELANYLGCHRTRVKKKYNAYIDALNLKRDYLTIYDVAKIDDLPPTVVALTIGVTDKNVLKACKIYENQYAKNSIM